MEINLEFCRKCKWYHQYKDTMNITFGASYDVCVEWCNKDNSNFTIMKDKEVPDKCPYSLEHLVMVYDEN